MKTILRYALAYMVALALCMLFWRLTFPLPAGESGTVCIIGSVAIGYLIGVLMGPPDSN